MQFGRHPHAAAAPTEGRQAGWFGRSRQQDAEPGHEFDAVLSAARNGEAGRLKRLLAHGPYRYGPLGHTPLHEAVLRDESATVAAMLAAGARPDERTLLGGFTPLMVGARFAARGLLDKLVEAGADLFARDPDGRTALTWAALDGRREIVKWLETKELIASEHDDGRWTTLIETCFDGDADAVRMLLAAGADPSARHGEGGWPAIVAAASQAGVEVVQALIDAKADVNATTGNGITPLLVAAGRPDAEVVAALLAAGAKPNVVAHGGHSPLTKACETGDVASVMALLAAGASRDIRIDDGPTPLMLACRHEHLALVPMLLPERKQKLHVFVRGREDPWQTANFGSAVNADGTPDAYDIIVQKPRDARTPERNDAIELRWRTSAGEHRLAGRFVGPAREPEVGWRIRPIADARIVESRRWTRVACEGEAGFVVEGEPYPARTVDVSEGGASFKLPLDVLDVNADGVLGADVEVSVILDGVAKLSTLGVIVRAEQLRDRVEVGVAFGAQGNGLGDVDREHVRAFVREQLRRRNDES